MITSKAIEQFQTIHTPFYYYDMELLNQTLKTYTDLTKKYGYHAHYALKANAEPRIVETIKNYGLGADCVSGNEVALAIKAGFSPDKIVYAGVGKSDKEIKTALKAGIFSFNCESVPEIKVINDFAKGMGKVAKDTEKRVHNDPEKFFFEPTGYKRDGLNIYAGLRFNF